MTLKPKSARKTPKRRQANSDVGPFKYEEIAADRIRGQTDVILQSLALIRSGNPRAAEPVRERRIARLQRRNRLPRTAAEDLSDAIEKDACDGGHRRRERESRDGVDDFLPVATFTQGAQLSRCVVCLFKSDRGQGTGFMISDRLLITNNHVISSRQAAREQEAAFDYEMDTFGQSISISRYQLDPDAFFLTSPEEELDYTIVAVGPCTLGEDRLAGRGCIELSSSSDKHAIGERAIIIQHPNGGPKMVVTGENFIVSRLDNVIHYTTDTDTGSSGAPVFSETLNLIALHHYGAPFLALRDENGLMISKTMNEGVRISAIVDDLLQRMSSLPASQRVLAEAILQSPGPESMTAAKSRPLAERSHVEVKSGVGMRINIEIRIEPPA